MEPRLRLPVTAAGMHVQGQSAGRARDAQSHEGVCRRNLPQSPGAQRAPSCMATRRVAVRGRWIVGAVLVGFVLTTAAVVARRSYGDAQARQMSGMEARLRQLDRKSVV